MSEHATPTAMAAGAVPAAGNVARSWARALGRMLALSVDETRVARRGFEVDSPAVVLRLEQIGASFVVGFNQALGSASLDDLLAPLQAQAPDDAGFAYEGAAMGLTLGDALTPGRRCFEAFVAGPAREHVYMAWVGHGWALAKLPLSPLRRLQRGASILRWLALDGWGFHDGYFDWPRSVDGQRRPWRLTGAAGQVYDQGLGRSLWFVRGANPVALMRSVAAFAPARRADLWAGLGLAAAYAGGVDGAALTALRSATGEHAAAFGQGVVFAAEARQRAGNAVDHTAMACELILGCDIDSAARLARQCLPAEDGGLTDYQRWRLAIQADCAELMATAQRSLPLWQAGVDP
ncbi:MAG: DUF1702 family protein [Alphaproteobacteria bacterium]|nr:DUF1702 family protein [Alphaproteobacteria bacterium]